MPPSPYGAALYPTQLSSAKGGGARADRTLESASPTRFAEAFFAPNVRATLRRPGADPDELARVVLRRLRLRSRIPVIVLSARQQADDNFAITKAISESACGASLRVGCREERQQQRGHYGNRGK